MLRSNSFCLKTSKSAGMPVRLKASDISLLRNIYKSLDSTKSNRVDLNELLLSIEQSGPSYDSLKSHCRSVRDQIKGSSKGQLTFLELLILLCPGAPANELEQIVRQYAPSLYDAESKTDLDIQNELDRMGQPRCIEGETRQSRRIRLAISRATLPTTELNLPDDSQVIIQMEQIQSFQRAKIVHKPIVRVSFHKRSEEASRLMQYSALRRPLLSMDGLPLHSHPALQLQGGIDSLDDEGSTDEQCKGIKRSSSIPLVDRKVRTLPGETHSQEAAKLRKAKIGSFYAHLFRKQLLPETERQQLLALIEDYDIEQAATLFQKLIGQKFFIDSLTLRAIMNGALKCERSDITIRCFLMATTAEGDPSPGKHAACPDPDVACYNALIEAYGCAGNMEAALNVRELLSLRKVNPNGETYNSWIRAAVMNDQKKLVKRFLHEMDSRGYIYSLGRDIKHSLGEESIQLILEKQDKLRGGKEKLMLVPRSVPHDTKFDLRPLKLKQESDQVFKSSSASIFSAEVDDLEKDLIERIATFRLTAHVLGEDGDCYEEYAQIKSRICDLEAQMKELQLVKAAMEGQLYQIQVGDVELVKDDPIGQINQIVVKNADQIGKSSNISSNSCIGWTSVDSCISVDLGPPDSEQGNSKESENMTAISSNLFHQLEPGMKVVLKQSTSEPRSISSQIDFVVRRPPFLVTKTITATPKSHSTGEFIIVVTLMLNEPVQSLRGDRITIDIKGFQNIPTDDCDLPIFGVGSRLCVNGGAKWVKSTGCISMDIIENAVVPSDIPAVFRFSLSVNTEIGHPPVTPTIAMYNRSRSFDTGDCKMEGEILHFLPSTSRRLKAVPLVRKQQSQVSKSDLKTNFGHDKESNSANSSLTGYNLNQTMNFTDWGSNLGSGDVKQQDYCLDYGFVNSWRPKVIKVFLSASNRDMAKERAHLEAKVFPSIRQMCETAGIVFIVVDLRHGETSADFKQNWALKTILDEAKDCHYFICMIGESYGWHQTAQIDVVLFDEALRLLNSLPIQCKRIPGDSVQQNVMPNANIEALIPANQNARLKGSTPGSLLRRPMLKRMPSQRVLVTDSVRHNDTAHKQGAVPFLRSNSSSRFIDVHRPFEQLQSTSQFADNKTVNSSASESQTGSVYLGKNKYGQPLNSLLPPIAAESDKKLVRESGTNKDHMSSEFSKSPIHKFAKAGSFTRSPKTGVRSGAQSAQMSNKHESEVSASRRARGADGSTTPTTGLRSYPSQEQKQNKTSNSDFEFTASDAAAYPMMDKIEQEFVERLPPGSDFNFFINQVHAINNNHIWILDHLDSGLIELQILHRLKADISSQHRCLIFLRAQKRSDRNCIKDEDSYTDSFLKSEAAIKLHTLKKKLNSGEFGRIQLEEYEQPNAGSELVGRQLEALIKADWLNGQGQQNNSVNINLLRLEENHKSFGLACLMEGSNLYLQQQRFLAGWVSRSDTDTPFILHGASGSGKTAFLALFWKGEVSSKNWGSTMAHFAEVDSSGVRAMIRCCASLSNSFPNLEGLPGTFKGLCTVFSALQNEEASNATIACKPSKVLLILDSINELSDENGAKIRLFEHLPKKIASHIKMVLSTNSDRDMMSWPITHQWTMCEIPSLSKSESLNLAQKYLINSPRHPKFSDLDLLDFGHKCFQTRAVMLSLFSLCSFNFLLHDNGVFFDSKDVHHVWAAIFHDLERNHGLSIVRATLICLSLSRDGMSMEEICAFLKFSRGKVQGDVDFHPDITSAINPLIVSAILWPFKSTKSLWCRGNLMNLSTYLKPIICGHYSSEQSGNILWHELLGEFFSQVTTVSDRVVREFPYHLMKANSKDKLKQFLCHPQWSAEMICCFHSTDLFGYWKLTGKTVLTNSYTRALFKPQCWGCTCRRTQCEDWVDEFIKHGLTSHLKATRIADSLEKEIIQRTGKKSWLREDILEHIRFHNIHETQPTLMASPFRADRSSDSTADTGNTLDWDDSSSIQCLRIAVQILRDSIDVITVESIAKLKEAKLRLSKAEEMDNIIPKEISKLAGVTRVLLMLDMEHSQHNTKSPLQKNVLDAESCEVTVESIADLGNIGIASFPLSVKVGNEVMTATKLQGNTFTVIRSNHRKRSHQCCFLVSFVIRTGTESGFESNPSIADNMALWLDVNINQIEISNSAGAHSTRDETLLNTSGVDECEKKCCIRCVNDTEATRVKLKLDTAAQPKFDIIDGPTTEIYRPHLYTEIVVPNRLIALDHYWCAHLCYQLKHVEHCENHLKKCIDILGQICHQTDHLLVQSNVFLWLLLVESGAGRAAREKAQELINFEKDLFQLNKKVESQAHRITTQSKNLFKIAREADDMMNGDKKRFQEKLLMVKSLLAPSSLFELESSAFMHIDGMWLSIHIEEARDLFPMDLNGTDDPFCTVSLNFETKRTATHMRTLNVIFDEELVFFRVQPDPDMSILLDVWDWDGPGRQDLIGYAQLSLRSALDKEGETVVFSLSRMIKGKGVQAEGIKVGTNGMCGYLSVRFEFSNALRQALFNRRQRITLQEAVQHRVISSESHSVKKVVAKCITLLEPEQWDETTPVSTSDEGAWMSKFSFLYQVKSMNESQAASCAVLNAAKAYFGACNKYEVSPHPKMLKSLERMISFGVLSTLYLHDLVDDTEDSGSSLLAAISVLEHLASVNCLELGSCKIDGALALKMAPLIAQQTELHSLYFQSNTIGDDLKGLEAVKYLVASTSYCHLNVLCLANNRLQDYDIAKLLCNIPANSCLQCIDISHNNGRKLCALAISWLLKSSISLKELNCSWNQLGCDSQVTSAVPSLKISSDSPDNRFHAELCQPKYHRCNSGKDGLTCRETLLINDTDGRWVRHFLLSSSSYQGFDESIKLICRLFNASNSAEVFLSAYSNYISAAQAVQSSRNLYMAQFQHIETDSTERRLDQLLDLSESSATSLSLLEDSEAEKKYLKIKECIVFFQSKRDDVFKARDMLLQTLKDTSAYFEAQTVLSEMKEIHDNPLFSNIQDPGSKRLSAAEVIFVGLEQNKVLETFDLSWNNLGMSSSLDISKTIGRVLSAGSSSLKVLNLSSNNFSFITDPQNSFDFLSSAIKESCSVQHLNLNGNKMSQSNTRCLAQINDSYSQLEILLRNCCDTITHFSLYDPRNPFGKYSLSLEDTPSRNLVRSLISMVCRRQGSFRQNAIYHSTEHGLEKVSIPLTEFMKWENWTVPNYGTAIFELMIGENKTMLETMPQPEFERFQNLLRSEVSTKQRRCILKEISESKCVLCSEQRQALLSDLRDLPELTFFLAVDRSVMT